MFSENLIQLRKLNRLTQEELAEKVGVSRQTVAKWEAGESVPDLERSRLLADALGVTLDDLATYEPAGNLGLAAPPKGKYFFGVVKVEDSGRITIPEKAMKVFGIAPGDQLVALGDETQGLAFVKPDGFLAIANAIKGVVDG